MMHGIWILGFVALLPWLLQEVPMAALGGVLVVTGWRLVSLKHVRHLLKAHGPLPAAIWAVTFVLVVSTDLLTGVLVGLRSEEHTSELQSLMRISYAVLC